MKKIRFFSLVAFAAATSAFGLSASLSASEMSLAENGNLYHRPGGTPEFVCICGGGECAPCLKTDQEEQAE